ncbi:MAG: hypothetical protein IRZ18_03860 [Clostridia bacterium]|nr:hypothetical protein [Clostridia bacterium]
MTDLDGRSGGRNWDSSFHMVLEHLIGQTVEIQTNDSAFSGKLADVETTFVTLASTTDNGGSGSVALVYIPIRKINAVTND